MSRSAVLTASLRKGILVCCLLIIIGGFQYFSATSSMAKEIYDIVILNGRVIDPESKLDAVRNIGISGGTIKAISTGPLNGRTVIDARGFVVSPGFIDLHQHGQNDENYRYKVMDGVTTALELEIGTADIDKWYSEREGKARINYGVSIGHVPVRMALMRDPGTFLPRGEAARKAASEAEIAEIKRRIEHGLQRGAVAVGFGIQYTPTASHWEILEVFRVAARFNALCHVHMRHAGVKEPASSVRALEEAIAAAAITGAPLHIAHVHSTGVRATPSLLMMIGEARSRKIDITTECYPYTAGMTDIKSAIFDEGWREMFEIDYKDLQWAATGERLNKDSFEQYRKIGGFVAVFSISDEVVESTLKNPLTIIASDGILDNGNGHPRVAGTYTRVLSKYVREKGALTLMDAIRKMTLMPAQRLEQRVTMMKNKGRIRVGADADITIFDLERVTDMSTYKEPAKYAEGIKYVMVNGVMAVKDGQLQTDIYPGRQVRAPIKSSD